MKKILKTALASFMAIMMSNQIAEAQKVKTEVRNGKNYIVHKVQKGETFYSIAKEYKANPKDIQTANPNVAVLKTDNTLFIPTDEKIEKVAKVEEKKTPVLKAPTTQTHITGATETLFSIAKKYDMTIDELKELNNLENNKIGPGQELIVSTSKRKKEGKLAETKGVNTMAKNKDKKEKEVIAQRPKTPLKATPKAEPEEYTIKKGETLFSIAKEHGIKTDDILAINEDLHEDKITEGKSILIPVNANKKPVEKVEKETEKTDKEVEETPKKSVEKPADKNAKKSTETKGVSTPITPVEIGGNPFGDEPITEDYAKEKSKKVVPNNKKDVAEIAKKEAKKVEEKVEKELPTNGEEPVYHTIKSNESFESIRQIYNVSRTELKYWNNYEWDNNKLKVGQQIVVYKPKFVSHKVTAGEKMKSIADKYHVKVRQIEIWNNLQHEQPALVGKTFTIYEPTGPKPDAEYLKRKQVIEEQIEKNKGEMAIIKPNEDPKKLGENPNEKNPKSKLIEHTVEKGQGLYSITKKYKVSTEDVLKWNNLKDNGIKTGQKLKIYTAVVEKTPEKAPEIKKETSVVKKDVPIINNEIKQKPLEEKNDEKDAFAVNDENKTPLLRGSGNVVADNLPKKDENTVINPSFGGNNQVITPTDLNTILQTGYAQVIPDIPSPKNQAALHRDIEPGTTLVVKNMQNGKITMVEVAAKLNPTGVGEDVILQVSPSVYQKLGIDGTEKVEVEISYVKKVK